MSQTIPATLPQTAATPAAMLEALILLLASATADDGSPAPLVLRDRGLDDPTIALLDAWVTVADVIGFYQERIAAEGYLRTAVEPGSILALASLTGRRPRPGLAARVHLAYTLNPDPADKAVNLPAGMLSQSVPGAGETPQTFETEQALIARPSWNTLALKQSTPLTVPDPTALEQLMLAGATLKLSPNDVILLDLAAGAPPAVLRVASAVASPTAATTTVALQTPPAAALHSEATPTGAEGPPTRAEATPTGAEATPTGAEATPTGAEATPTGAQTAPRSLLQTLAALATGLTTPPAHAVHSTRSRSPAAVFAPTSDAAPRVLAALHPALAPTLYQALATSGLAARQVLGASVLRVKTIPFGAQTPPRTIHDDRGQPVGTEELPIADTAILQIAFPGFGYPPDAAADLFAEPGAIAVTARTATSTAAATVVEDPHQVWHGSLAPLGSFELRVTKVAVSTPGQAQVQRSAVTATYKGTGPPDPTVVLKATPKAGGAIELELGDGDRAPGRYSWNPELTAPLRVDLGLWRLSIEWVTAQPPAAAATTAAAERLLHARLGHDGPQTPATLTITLETLLPFSDPRVLALDGRFDAILPGTRVFIEAAPGGPGGSAASAGSADSGGSGGSGASGASGGSGGSGASGGSEGSGGSGGSEGSGDEAGSTGTALSRYPLITTVTAVASAVVTRYGRTAQATVLTLADDWIGDERTLAALRTLTVRAQPDPLTVAPTPVTDDLAGATIELDALVAGLDAGRPLIVTGTRTDLPEGASAPAGEVVHVAAVTHGTTPGVEGDAVHTTLTVVPPLAFTYARGSVAIFANVVGAHQGATTTEVLGSGTPSQAHQTFTLSSAPVLAVAAPTASGSASTLAVSVNGTGYSEALRIDAATPPRSFVTGTDAQGRTTITFAAPLPSGAGNVVATYRAGDGGAGNVRPHQVTQLLSRPLGVATVDNPLPASGGSPADGQEQLRASAASGFGALGRIVSVADYADLARSWAGVADASSVLTTGAQGQVVLVTIAGTAAVPLDPAGVLCSTLSGALGSVGDPTIPVVVAPAELLMMVVGATVTADPAVAWETVAAGVRAALLAAFGYAARSLDQDVLTSALVAAAHTASGVLAFSVDALGLVSASSTPEALAALPAQLAANVPPRTTVKAGGPDPAGLAGGAGPLAGLQPAQIAYLSDAVPDTLVLRRHVP